MWMGSGVNACLTLAMTAEGSNVTTIEGLATNDQLHPMQEAFIKHDGFQCGYCTPGQIMSAVACIREGHADSPGGGSRVHERQPLPLRSLRQHCGGNHGG